MYLWIDVDCFECQVWSLIHPELQNGPLLIHTDSEFENDIASFNYQAKACGISRKDTIESAKEKCPALKVFRRSSNDELKRTREKIELSIKNFIMDELGNRVQLHWTGNEEGYLNIGDEVDLQISKGIKYDEENVWKTNVKWIFGNEKAEDDDIARYYVAVNILAVILRRIQLDTGLIASGSIGVTNMIARLACPINKPQGITVVTANGLDQLFTLVKIEETPGLKGITGQKIVNKWKKPDGTRLESLLDFKEHVPFTELKAEGYVKKPNKDAMVVMSHWINVDSSNNRKNIQKASLKINTELFNSC